MKITIITNRHSRQDTFTIVDKIPEDYQVWNIGNLMIDGYLPLCQLVPDTYNVILETLLAIHLPDNEIEIIRRATGYGINSLTAARETLNNPDNNEVYIKLAKAALPIFEKITEKGVDK